MSVPLETNSLRELYIFMDVGRFRRGILIIHSIANELNEDAKATIGEDRLEWRVIEGGHEFPISRPDEVVDEIAGVWEI